MRYMIVHNTEVYYDRATPPPAELMTGMDALLGDMNKAGVLLAAEGLRHPDHGVKITYSKGNRTVTDGPYAEAKEVVAGFMIVDVRSRDEAIEWANRFGAIFDNIFDEIVVEVRPVGERSDFE
ncbi:transcriptional regulator [Antrihabitans sp. YC3-6]|uniref:Transcriptional regulator n=1 Tax=Antrihabitans stalagmiti TaxID=2799499 RepID=A0A934U0A4_9NOCA|nr:YciI family protein [Antrihabitans stalagmiti]MBJ8337396.1 transcriptional regulator [Antrihabitans stalagmiti]